MLAARASPRAPVHTFSHLHRGSGRFFIALSTHLSIVSFLYFTRSLFLSLFLPFFLYALFFCCFFRYVCMMSFSFFMYLFELCVVGRSLLVSCLIRCLSGIPHLSSVPQPIGYHSRPFFFPNNK